MLHYNITIIIPANLNHRQMQHTNIFIRLSNVSYKLLITTALLLFSTTHSQASDRDAFDKETSDRKASGNNTIVVTLKPLYSLAAHLTEGIETPVLLIKQTPSSHHYNMRPSERMALANADVIIWFGSQMEPSLTTTIQQIKNSTSEKTLVISAIKAEHLKLLNKRTKHSQEKRDHNNYHSKDHLNTSNRTDKVITDEPNQQNIDPHIWLSTQNAAAISKHITALLISVDPKNTELYNKNLRQLLNKIKQTKAFIQTTLNTHSVNGQIAQNQPPLNKAPFIAYHDAFQYFENENQLNYIDSISYNEETGPGLKHIRQIKNRIEKNNIQCLVYQQPKPAIVDSLTTQTGIKATALDPLGRNVSNNKNAWFELMRQLAKDFKLCLQK